MVCPASRVAAKQRLAAFVPLAEDYARDRNYVMPGHPAVSRLSPAIRHRLITEEEVVSAVLRAHPLGGVEKFVQEVYWRRYWKSWLAHRPDVWAEFVRDLDALPKNPVVQQVEAAQSGNRVIDHFAAELVATGYLHNHARMWFAGWWVHQARLPWQSGAAFFYRHLLDGDPAANTLSWRWVAGWQTPGKSYLTRRDNLEKYLAPQLRESLAEGLAAFTDPQALPVPSAARSPVPRLALPPHPPGPVDPAGLWVHEEDLAVETSALGERTWAAIAVTANVAAWDRWQFPNAKRQWISDALRDAGSRAESVWRSPALVDTSRPHLAALLDWARSQRLRSVVALRPDVGPLQDSLPSLEAGLASQGIRLVLWDRPEDLRLRPLATGGFFPFWERLRKQLLTRAEKNESSSLAFSPASNA